MEDDLAAVRAAAAQRYAAANAAAPAVPREESSGAGGSGACAADSDEALAWRLQAEEYARGAGGARNGGADDDDDVQIIEPPPAKRQRAESAQPLLPWQSGIGFRLTHVEGLAAQYNAHAVKLEDIFPLAQAASAKWVLLTNYQYEFPWLLDSCPALQLAPQVFMLTSDEKKGFSGVKYVKANLRRWQTWSPPVSAFATHHSKAMIVVYEDRCRVCVHTANYLSCDWDQKSQGVWVQDFPLKAAGAAAGASSAFEDDLIAYLEGTGWPGSAAPGVPGRVSAASLRAFDFSGARVALVGSVPGTSSGASADRWGYRRMAALLSAEAFDARFVGAPLLCQYTSTGSLQQPWLIEFFSALSAGRTAAGAPLGAAAEQRLVWPTEQEVRFSREGWAAGTSIPGSHDSIQRLHKMHNMHNMHNLRNMRLCRWAPSNPINDTCPEGRAQCMPHIKTFLRHDGEDIAWLLLCSHNLSAEAAWGKAYTNNDTFSIKSFELGVLFLPSLLAGTPGAGDGPVRMVSTAANGGMPPGLRDGVLALPLPYMLPPERYSHADEPWDWQTPRAGLDSQGLSYAGVSHR